jgi:hypothetical protein
MMIEDIGTTGDSVRGAARAIEEAGGIIAGYGFIWIRDRKRVNQATMGAPVFSLIDEGVRSWKPGAHPHWGDWPLVMDIGRPENIPHYPGPSITLRS